LYCGLPPDPTYQYSGSHEKTFTRPCPQPFDGVAFNQAVLTAVSHRRFEPLKYELTDGADNTVMCVQGVGALQPRALLYGTAQWW
jgi:hypothetical protein